MREHIIKNKATVLVGCYLLLFLFLLSTDPTRLPIILLLIPFLLLFACIFGTIFYALLIFPAGQLLTPRKRLLVAVASALLPVVLLVMKSINQLTLRDGFILSIFIFASGLYISRTGFAKLR